MQDKEYIAVLIQSLEKNKEILDKIIARRFCLQMKVQTQTG